MTKIFKPSEIEPHALAAYEREVLEDMFPGVLDPNSGEVMSPAMTLEAARAEAARKVQEAYAAGYQRGLEAGKAEFDASVAGSAEALRRVSEGIEQARKAFLESLEPQVIELTQTLVAAVVNREARTDPELVRVTARRALEALLDREGLVIHVNPADLDAMRAHKVSLLEEFDGVRDCAVRPDDSIAPGGCLVESELMLVDARLEAQLERVFDALKDVPELTPVTPTDAPED